MSALPAGWAPATFGDVTVEKVEQCSPSPTDDFVYVDIGSIDNRTKVVTAPKVLAGNHAPSRARQRLTEGDVLVSMTRPNLNAVAMISAGLHGAVGSTGFHILRADSVSPKWLYYVVQADDFIATMSALVQGVLYPAVRPNDLRSYVFPLPPLAEQSRIVAAIEEQFTRLDAADAALARVRANLRRYRAAVLDAAVSGRLVPTEAELARDEGRAYETAAELVARVRQHRRDSAAAGDVTRPTARSGGSTGVARRRYVEAEGRDLTNLSGLPEGWAGSTLGQLFRVFVGATPSRVRSEYWLAGTIPWVSSGEVAFCTIRHTRERISELALSKTSTTLHEPGTVLLGMIGEGRTRGQAAILAIAACNNQNSAAIRVAEAGLIPEYVYRFLEREYRNTRQIGSGNNQPALNKTKVESIAIAVPPLAEQQRIVAEVERRLSLVEQMEAAVAGAERRAAALRRSILKRAFEGKLVPQCADDEPAAVLLERIRAERASAEPRLNGRAPRARRKASS